MILLYVNTVHCLFIYYTLSPPCLDAHVDICVFSQLYGLYKTAKDGPAPPPTTGPKKLGHVKARPSVVLTLSSSTGDGEESAESVAAMQLQAWRDCGDMSSIDAMRTFCVTLFSLHQNWDYELR